MSTTARGETYARMQSAIRKARAVRDATRLAAGRAAMLRLAAAVRRSDGTLPAWRLPFELARVLRRVPGPPDPVFWEPVAVVAPADRFDAAVRLALAGPLPMAPDPGVTYGPAARVCFHLSEMAGGGPFPLPVERLGDGCGRSKMWGSRAVQWLARVGVIAVVGEPNHTARIARTVRFLATVPDVA